MNVKMFQLLVLVVGSVVLCCEAHELTVVPYLSRTAEQFHFSEWGGRTKVPYGRALLSWSIPELSLPTNGIGIHVTFTHGEERDDLQIYPTERRLYMLEIVARKCPDVLSAHWALLSHFESMQSTCDYNSATNDFGDRSYLTRNGAVFARNNIYVSVLSLTNLISAEAVARQIDADILRKSTENVFVTWVAYGLVVVGLLLSAVLCGMRMLPHVIGFGCANRREEKVDVTSR